MPDGVALHCFGGCTTTAVLESLNCSVLHLFHESPLTPAEHHRTWGRRAWPTFPPMVTSTGGGRGRAGLTWEKDHFYGKGRWKLERYRRTDGEKSLLWWTRDANSCNYRSGLLGVPTSKLPLYFEHEVVPAVALGDAIVLVESESSVDALRARALVATTWAGGADSPPLERLRRVLAGGRVLLVPDHDEPGLACGRRLWAELEPVVAQLAFLLPEPGQDARDLLAAHGPAIFTDACSTN